MLLLLACFEPPAKPTVVGARAEGTLFYAAWIGDEVWCDFTFNLEASSDEPVCVGCDFELDVYSGGVEARVDDDCVLDPRYSLQNEWEDLTFRSLRYDADAGSGYMCPYGYGSFLYVEYAYFGYDDGGCSYGYGGPGWYYGDTRLAAIGEGLTHEDRHLEWFVYPRTSHAWVYSEPPVADRLRVWGYLDFTPVYDTAPPAE